MSLGKKLIGISSIFIIFAIITDIVQAESVYAITNHSTSKVKVSAYDINGDQITHQTDANNLENNSNGAAFRLPTL